MRFLGYWGGLFALLAGGSACPCCGSPSCPGGAASAGFLAGLGTGLLYAVQCVKGPAWRMCKMGKRLYPKRKGLVGHE